ncbi:MAG: TIGR03089 family protein [Rothia sp. (in: high G+C Gram-positive bacteria)]|nr:TIGR03089 family protein [Rothia sp. (in: high G+C Gram-positive bacteria)]
MTTQSPFKSFPAFFDQLARRQEPALIWYSEPGERLEFSGRVLDNWVAKTLGLLEEEGELEPGSCLLLPKELHWRSLLLALAAIRLGARVVFAAELSAAELAELSPGLLVTFDPSDLDPALASWRVLALPRQPLATSFGSALPAGVLDYAALVPAFPDQVWSVLEAEPADLLLGDLSLGQVSGQLGVRAAEVRALAAQEGVLSFWGQGEVLGTSFLLEALAVWAAGSGFLLLDPAASWPKERLSRVLGDEGARPLLA